MTGNLRSRLGILAAAYALHAICEKATMHFHKQSLLTSGFIQIPLKREHSLHVRESRFSQEENTDKSFPAAILYETARTRYHWNETCFFCLQSTKEAAKVPVCLPFLDPGMAEKWPTISSIDSVSANLNRCRQLLSLIYRRTPQLNWMRIDFLSIENVYGAPGPSYDREIS